MSQKEGYSELAIIKEIIQKDQYLFDRVIDKMRELRQTSGQNMEDFMKNKREAEKSQSAKRHHKQKQDF